MHENFETCVKDADMKELTLLQDFLPDCFNQAKNLEEFVKDILKEKHKQKDQDANSKNCRVQIPMWWVLVQTLVTDRKTISSVKENAPVEMDKVKDYV